jgi:hypothetical protein
MAQTMHAHMNKRIKQIEIGKQIIFTQMMWSPIRKSHRIYTNKFPEPTGKMSRNKQMFIY